MANERTDALEALLAEAEAAHGVFETTELNGVYDADWPRWYAGYVIDHGVERLLTRPITLDDLAEFFTRTWEEAQAAGSASAGPWPRWMATRIAAEL